MGLLYILSPWKSLYYNLLWKNISYRKNTLRSDLMRDKYLEHVICDLIMFIQLLDVSAHYGFLILEDSDCAEDLYIWELPINYH
jgi:hypothetical protein